MTNINTKNKKAIMGDDIFKSLDNDTLFIGTIINWIENDVKLAKKYISNYRSRKYDFKDILKHIFCVIRDGLSWRRVIKIKESNMKHTTLYNTFKNMIEDNIIDNCYAFMVNKKIKEDPKKNLNIRITDTTSIHNKYGIEGAKYNGHKKGKKITKISLITNENGIPIDVNVYDGNKNDGKILEEQLKDGSVLLKDIDDLNKNIFLADKGYDSKNVRTQLINEGFKKIIIGHNKRNTKDENKIKNMTKKENKIYKKRINIEIAINKMKRYKRIEIRYEHKKKTYLQIVKLALMDIILKHK